MKYLVHVPEGNKSLTKEEITESVWTVLDGCPSEHTCAYRVWYEGFDGCGRPSKEVVSLIEDAIGAHRSWKAIGPMRFEKFGVVSGFVNTDYASAAKKVGGDVMPLHMYHQGRHYRGPDGRIFWLAVIEVFDIRCFEWKDGKYIGQMVEIDPMSDYAKQMVEVKI